MSKLVLFLKSFYDSPTYRCLILGVDDSGKTTALYRMVLGTVVSAIPTIGFNFEEVHVGNDVLSFWDIGGCDKIRPLMRHYMMPGHSILFLVNTPSCLLNQKWFDYTMEELVYLTNEASNSGLLFIGIALVKQDLLPVSGVEGDLKGQISYVVNIVKDLMERIFPRGFGRNYDIYTNEKQGGISAMTGPGFEDGWLVKELLGGIKRASAGGKMNSERYLKENSLDKARKRSDIPITPPPPHQNDTRQKLPLDMDQLRALIVKQNSEDLYTDLAPREFLKKMELGTLERWDHRAHLRAGFYVLIDHLKAGHGLWDAAEDFLVKLENMLSNDSKRADAEGGEKRFRNTVHRTMTTFYLHSIHTAILAFMDHHSSSHMVPKYNQFDEFLLLNPHLMDSSLWSAYYSRAVISSPVAKSSWRLPDLKPLPDHIRFPHATTLQDIGGVKKAKDSHRVEDNLRRFAFATLQRVRFTGERRGKIVKEALEVLQRHTMSLRAKGVDVEPYSETKAYFWIQILHAAVASLGTVVGTSGIDITKLSFESFVLLFPDLMRQRDKGKEFWRLHYTEKSWESMEARMGVVLPSLRPLPNIIVPPTETEKDAAVTREMEIRSLVQNGTERNISETEMMLHEFWVISEIQEASGVTASHGKVLWQIFLKLWKTKAENLMSVSVASNELVGEDLKSRGGILLGVTEKVFWVRVVLKQFLSCEITFPATGGIKGHGEDHAEISLSDFRRFLGQNRELLLEDFWRCYYSEETWHSGDAKERFVQPDLKEMAKFA